MHQRTLRGLFRAALVIVIVVAMALAAGATSANASLGTITPGSSFGPASCTQLSGLMFQQPSDFCFYFPDGTTDIPALCDPSFCGLDKFLLPSSGTLNLTLNYPSPAGFTIFGLQLCHDNQTVPDPATCSQTMSPGGAGAPGCAMDPTTSDNSTPFDTSDDTGKTTLNCPIPVGDPINQYTLIVYPLGVQHCDLADMGCSTDPMQGVTAALSGTFSGILTSPGPAGAKAEGGGELAPQQHFSLHAENNQSKWSHAHTRFANSTKDATRCTFAADGANYVDIEPNMFGDGGTAFISGTGTVTDSLKVKHSVTYQLQVSDGGKGGTDTFQLSAPGCDTGNLPVPVSHGNINIQPDKDND
jgi:hypothetical protein